MRNIKRQTLFTIMLLIVSILFGSWLYINFFFNLLPRFFANMESLEKNALALLIVIATIFIFTRMIFHIETKIERYVLLSLYLLVLIVGLLRPDQVHTLERGLALNPLGFIDDIRTNPSSMMIMIINIIIFMPMYFLLERLPLIKGSNLFIFASFTLFVFLVEYLQYRLNVGIFDLSDVFLYYLGFTTGYILCLLARKGREKILDSLQHSTP